MPEVGPRCSPSRIRARTSLTGMSHICVPCSTWSGSLSPLCKITLLHRRSFLQSYKNAGCRLKPAPPCNFLRSWILPQMGHGAQTAGRFRIDAILSVPTDLRQNNPVDLVGALYGDEAVSDVAGD